MIYVAITPIIDGERVEEKKTVVEIEEGKDPFAILDLLFRKYPPDRQTTDNARAAHRTSTTPAAETSRLLPSREKAETLPRPAGVRDTSMAAYRSLEWSGGLSNQQKQLLQIIVSGARKDWTRKELEEASGIPINAVCGRVYELLNEPFAILEELEGRKCGVTGNTANPVRVVHQDVILKIVKEKT